MKKEINAFDYAKEIVSSIGKGILLTTKSGEKVNTMTIGWGTLGVEWGKPIFIAFVREGRFTRQMLDESMEFTVNVPLGHSIMTLSYLVTHMDEEGKQPTTLR